MGKEYLVKFCQKIYAESELDAQRNAKNRIINPQQYMSLNVWVEISDSDVVQRIIKDLPGTLQYEGCTFEFQIFHDVNELRMGYILDSCDQDSKHFEGYETHGFWINPFIGGGDYTCSFLYLQEGIENIMDLSQSVETMITWLRDRKLIGDENH